MLETQPALESLLAVGLVLPEWTRMSLCLFFPSKLTNKNIGSLHTIVRSSQCICQKCKRANKNRMVKVVIVWFITSTPALSHVRETIPCSNMLVATEGLWGAYWIHYLSLKVHPVNVNNYKMKRGQNCLSCITLLWMFLYLRCIHKEALQSPSCELGRHVLHLQSSKTKKRENAGLSELNSQASFVQWHMLLNSTLITS